MCGNDNTGSTANFGQLLNAHCIGEDVASLTAVLLRDRDTHKTVAGHLLDGLYGELLSLVHFLSKRLHFVFSKISE